MSIVMDSEQIDDNENLGTMIIENVSKGRLIALLKGGQSNIANGCAYFYKLKCSPPSYSLSIKN